MNVDRSRIGKLVVTATAIVAATAPFACSSDRDGGFAGGGGVFADASIDDAACHGGLRCSRDLRAVVDACDESRVITECPADQGCANATCVPACEVTASSGASVGCEFAALPPSRFREGAGSCFAAFVANTWAAPARIEAEYDGTPLDVARSGRLVQTSGDAVTYAPFDGELAPGQVAVLFLGQAEGPDPTSNTPEFWVRCPSGITPAVLADTSIRRTGRGSSFRIKTSIPVSAYSIYPFGGASSFAPSATLLLPIPAWKTGYVAVDAWAASMTAGNPSTQIVAAEDGTEVTIAPSVPIQAGYDVEGANKGEPHTYRLKRGEAIQIAQKEQLVGSVISANKSVAVFGGHECMNIPTEQYRACETTQLQLFPVRSWGHEYVAVPYRSRRASGLPEEYFYRIVAAVDGTELTYEPDRPTGAPPTLARGASVVFSTREPFVVRSQDDAHPFAAYAYMSGASFAPAQLDDGDPEFTFLVPPDQYLDHYAFFVDPSFRNSHIVVVRSRPDGKEFEPVELDCAGPLEGWQAVGTSGKYEFVRVPLTDLSVGQKVGTGTCGAGRRELQSGGPFGVTVWGTDNWASYAYPGGSAIRTLNDVEPITH
jgi:IgGFc binding protein